MQRAKWDTQGLEGQHSFTRQRKRSHNENPTSGFRGRHTQALHYHTQQLNQEANCGLVLLESTFLRLL